MLRGAANPFSADGGLKVLRGNLGRAVIKVSAVQPQHHVVEAPALVFTDQAQVIEAFKAGRLTRDVVVVLREQGPRANGMPELHKLTPALSVLQSQGHRVALVTDGRMSGASGTVPAAIHVSPESICDGPLAQVRDGDVIRLDARSRIARGAGGCGRVRFAPRRPLAAARHRTAAAANCSRVSVPTPPTPNPAQGPAIHEHDRWTKSSSAPR